MVRVRRAVVDEEVVGLKRPHHVNIGPFFLGHRLPCGPPLFTALDESHAHQLTRVLRYEDERGGFLAAGVQVFSVFFVDWV